MEITCRWEEKLVFTSESVGLNPHSVKMDSKPPLGTDTAMTPKQLVVAGLLGCTAMDVVSLLRKYKQPLEKFDLVADVKSTEGVHPAVFTSITLKFSILGQLDSAKVMEAVQLSQTKYCGVSAMLSKAVPITYTVDLNGNTIGSGSAAF